jgi:hypothetical protein
MKPEHNFLNSTQHNEGLRVLFCAENNWGLKTRHKGGTQNQNCNEEMRNEHEGLLFVSTYLLGTWDPISVAF